MIHQEALYLRIESHLASIDFSVDHSVTEVCRHIRMLLSL